MLALSASWSASSLSSSFAVAAVAIAVQSALLTYLVIDRVRRRKSEDALWQLAMRNAALVRAFPDMVFVLDKDGRYLDYHARDRSLLVAPPETFIGRTLEDIMPPALTAMFMEALGRALSSGEPIVVEYTLQLDDERHFEARLTSAGPGRIISIVRDVTEAKRAHALNLALAGRLITSQEDERHRIARELHDDFGQRIALLTIDVDQLARDVASRDHRAKLHELSRQAGELASDLHQLSHELHPSRLHTLGLVESIRLLCRDVGSQRNIRVTFDHNQSAESVDDDIALCLYRIAQEALHNVAKHSGAQDAFVRLTVDAGEAYLQIADSGIGFDPQSSVRSGLGLVSLRERVELLHGKLAIHAAPGNGTRIGVKLPLLPERASAGQRIELAG